MGGRFEKVNPYLLRGPSRTSFGVAFSRRLSPVHNRFVIKLIRPTINSGRKGAWRYILILNEDSQSRGLWQVAGARFPL